MRILYITNSLKRDNGWSSYAVDLVCSALEENDEVAVLAEDISGKIEGVKLYKNIRTKYLFWNPVYIFYAYVRYLKVIRDFKPDIVHVTAEPFVMPFAFGSSKPLLLTINGTYAILPNTVRNTIKRLFSETFFFCALKRVVHIISISERTKSKFLNYRKHGSTEISVIHPSIGDIMQIENATIKSTNPFHVITIGDVKERKGIHNAIALFRSWAESRRQKVVYDVIGWLEDGSPYVQDIKKKMHDAESQYFRVILHGRVSQEEKLKLLNNASVYAHLESVENIEGDVEGFGIGIVEAAYCHVPALVYSGSATNEAVRDGVTGYILDKTALPEKLYEKIDSILLNKAINTGHLTAWAEEHGRKRQYSKIRKIYYDALH